MSDELLEERFRVTTRMYQTLRVGVFLYGAIAYLAVKNATAGSPQGEGVWLLKYTLFFAALTSVMIIPKIQQRMLKVHPEEEEPEDAYLVEKLYKMQMFSLGMCEVPAFLGMVLSIVLKNLPIFLVFITIAYAGLFHYRPRWEDWKAYMRQTHYL